MDDLFSNISTENYGDLLTTTANKRSGKYTDIYFNENVTWSYFNKHKEVVDGGAYLEEDLEFDKNPTTGFINDNDIVPTTTKQILRAAMFPPTILAGSVSISDADKAKNNGAAKMGSLVDKREKNLIKAAALTGQEAFYNSSPAAEDPNSLIEIINTANPSRGNLGFVDRTEISQWQSNLVELGSFGLGGLDAMGSMIRLIAPSQGMDHPDYIITTSSIWGLIHAQMQNRVELTPGDEARAGFKSLSYNGIPIVYDEHCTAGNIFYLNKDYIRMKVYSGMNMDLKPYTPARIQLNMTRLFSHMYNITVNDPGKLGRHYGVTA